MSSIWEAAIGMQRIFLRGTVHGKDAFRASCQLSLPHALTTFSIPTNDFQDDRYYHSSARLRKALRRAVRRRVHVDPLGSLDGLLFVAELILLHLQATDAVGDAAYWYDLDQLNDGKNVRAATWVLGSDAVNILSHRGGHGLEVGILPHELQDPHNIAMQHVSLRTWAVLPDGSAASLLYVGRYNGDLDRHVYGSTDSTCDPTQFPGQPKMWSKVGDDVQGLPCTSFQWPRPQPSSAAVNELSHMVSTGWYTLAPISERPCGTPLFLEDQVLDRGVDRDEWLRRRGGAAFAVRACVTYIAVSFGLQYEERPPGDPRETGWKAITARKFLQELSAALWIPLSHACRSHTNKSSIMEPNQ